jgi:hypothetical protein
MPQHDRRVIREIQNLNLHTVEPEDELWASLFPKGNLLDRFPLVCTLETLTVAPVDVFGSSMRPWTDRDVP